MNEKIASKANNFDRVKNGAFDWWDVQILRKRFKTNSKIKQEQRKLITSKTSCRFEKQNLITKTCNSPEKILD